MPFSCEVDWGISFSEGDLSVDMPSDSHTEASCVKRFLVLTP